MLEPSPHRWKRTVLDVSCRVRLSSLRCFDAFRWATRRAPAAAIPGVFLGGPA